MHDSILSLGETISAPIISRMTADGGAESISDLIRQRWALSVLRRGLSIACHHRDAKLASGGAAVAERLVAEHGGLHYHTRRDLTVAIAEDWCYQSFGSMNRLFYAVRGGTPLCPGALELFVSEPAVATKAVTWWRMTPQGLFGQPMGLQGADPNASFYPWLDRSIPDFWREYMASDANVLVLIGAPGTGKTSFLRGGLRAVKADAWVTYDPAVQHSEEMYTRFASPERGEDGADDDDGDDDVYRLIGRRPLAASGAGRVLVLEDADEMLESRRDGNKLMSRILGIADGLVSLPKRKVVFTTNLPSLSSVDDALLRPGRCFAVLNFRKLTADEARAAAASVGHDREFAPGQYTLAEALRSRIGHVDPVRKLGF